MNDKHKSKQQKFGQKLLLCCDISKSYSSKNEHLSNLEFKGQLKVQHKPFERSVEKIFTFSSAAPESLLLTILAWTHDQSKYNSTGEGLHTGTT